MLFSIWPSPARTWPEVGELAQWAERHRWHGAWVADHFMPDTGTEVVADGPTNECWALLAALAATTSSLRIGPLVAPTTVHHPAVLANRAATIDRIAGGRFVLGLGAGWQINEHVAYGIDLMAPGPRVGRFAEAIEIVRSLLHEPRTTFHGEHFDVTDAPCDPKPTGDLPIVVGSARPRMLGIAARFADEWNCWGNPERIAGIVPLLDQACERAGRDPSTVRRSVQAMVVFADTPQQRAEAMAHASILDRALIGTPAEIAEGIDQLAAHGFGEFIVPDFWHVDDFARKRELYDRFAADVVPLVGR